MKKKSYRPNGISKAKGGYLNKQINRLIFALIILIGIYVLKIVNKNTTNKVLVFIEKNIYYDFNFKEDRKKINDKLIKIVKGSKGVFDDLTESMANRK